MNVASQGYQGLVDGGDNIKLAHWHSVTNIIQQVGKNLCIYLYKATSASFLFLSPVKALDCGKMLMGLHFIRVFT